MTTLPSGLSEKVDDEEELARYLTSSSTFAATKSLVKPGAFLPNRKNMETSVFRQGAEPPEELWEVAANQLPSEQTVHGAAIVEASVVREVSLEVVADENPPNGPKHANIVGWPKNDRDPREEKGMWKDLANAIASRADLVLKLNAR